MTARYSGLPHTGGRVQNQNGAPSVAAQDLQQQQAAAQRRNLDARNKQQDARNKQLQHLQHLHAQHQLQQRIQQQDQQQGGAGQYGNNNNSNVNGGFPATSQAPGRFAQPAAPDYRLSAGRQQQQQAPQRTNGFQVQQHSFHRPEAVNVRARSSCHVFCACFEVYARCPLRR